MCNITPIRTAVYMHRILLGIFYFIRTCSGGFEGKNALKYNLSVAGNRFQFFFFLITLLIYEGGYRAAIMFVYCNTATPARDSVATPNVATRLN